jgi:6-pyruvoyltetrahydropterin/6-carboxytetrahydropterin synthase
LNCTEISAAHDASAESGLSPSERDVFRICKTFTIESGHMLSKHPDRCRFPHGHSRTIELILSADDVDENDMVCDFKWIKLAIGEYLDTYDHGMCVNAADPALKSLKGMDDRVIVFEEGDPTTELMAKRIYEFLADRIRQAERFTTPEGSTYTIRPTVRLERVRVGETATTWAEYAPIR